MQGQSEQMSLEFYEILISYFKHFNCSNHVRNGDKQ